jgi:uncharacterized damage-inducible protein DinB
MDSLALLADSIEETVRGPVWHGSALGELLSGVSAAEAAARPVDEAHSIWELVLHITSWAAIAEWRLSLKPTGEPAEDEDWPPVSRPTPTAWKAALRQLGDAHRSLADSVRRLDPALLDRNVPRRQYTVRTMLHGVVEHGAYHGGQIAMLKRQLRR